MRRYDHAVFATFYADGVIEVKLPFEPPQDCTHCEITARMQSVITSSALLSSPGTLKVSCEWGDLFSLVSVGLSGAETGISYPISYLLPAKTKVTQRIDGYPRNLTLSRLAPDSVAHALWIQIEFKFV